MDCCEFGVCKQGHGCPARETPATTPPPATRENHMTPTQWLIAAIIIALAIALGALYFRARWREARQALDYRTIDVATMESDVRKLQRHVPDAPRPRQRAGQPAAVYSYPSPNLTQVRAQAISAALRDIGKHTSRPNPYREGSHAHSTWAEHYNRLTQDQAALQAEIEAIPAAQTRAPAEG